MQGGLKGRVGKAALKITIPIVIILIWEIMALDINNHFILPRVESVFSVLIAPNKDILGSGTLIDNSLTSLKRVSM
jgi:NitT/TauT family transport system permease protein